MKGFSRLLRSCGAGIATVIALSGPAFAQNTASHGKRAEDETKSQVEHRAKVPLAQARERALRRVPGTVVHEELEREHGRWIYSFEIRPQGEHGKRVKEVNIDSDSGELVNIETERG